MQNQNAMQLASSKILKNQYIPTSEFYSQLIDSLHDYSIFTVDNNLMINSWSSGSTAIFGYQSREVIGKHFDLIFTPEDKKNGIPKSEIHKARINGKAVNNRWHVRKNNNIFYAYGLVFPLTDVNGEKIGYVNILHDLTDRKRSDDALNKQLKELEELNAHKESILAILSHDLRSPLTRIIAITQYLKSRIDTIQPDELRQMVNFLDASSKDELNMLDYLVEWARIKYAAETFSPAKIYLYQYTFKVFETLSHLASAKNITLQNQIEHNITAYADGKMILSIIQNITSNAIANTNNNGIITITAKRKVEEIIVEIKDNGIGMSKLIQKNIFTPKINTLSKARQENKGAGIGLLLTKSFVEKNNGRIWVTSVEGVGTSFYFSLPLNKPLEKLDNDNIIQFSKITKNTY